MVEISTNTGLYTVKTNENFDFRPNFTLLAAQIMVAAIGAYNLAGRARGDHNRTEYRGDRAASIIVGSIGIKWVWTDWVWTVCLLPIWSRAKIA